MGVFDARVALSDTAERLRKLIAHFRLTEARRQAVNIPVTARCRAWPKPRTARIVDLSATGARIERTLSIKLKRREVSADIPQTARRDAAPVIVMPPAARHEQQRPKSFRFSGKPGRRPVRCAV